MRTNESVPTRLPAPRHLIVLALVATLAGCEAIGTIFQAGVWVGVMVVIAVVAIVAVIAAILRR